MNRQTILNQIKKMEALINDTASNPNMVSIAMAKIAKWREEYNITDAELDIKQQNETISNFKTRTYNKDGSQPIIHLILRPIAQLTETRLIVVQAGTNFGIGFYGTTVDVAYAEYLWRLCGAALEQAIYAYKGNNDLKSINDFIEGFVKNLAHRILELIPPPVPGNSLIVLKNAIITKELGDLGEGAGATKALTVTTDNLEAILAGMREAAKVPLRYQTGNETRYLEGGNDNGE